MISSFSISSARVWRRLKATCYRSARFGLPLLAGSWLSGCEAELSKNPMFGDDPDQTEPEPKPDASSTPVRDAATDASSPIEDAAAPILDASLPIDADVPDASPHPDAEADAEASVPVDSCANGDLDPGEAAPDCGGVCDTPCELGDDCNDHSDCESGICNEVCVTPGCANDFLDDNESDVDCGGVCSSGCADGLWCEVDLDCKSKVCGPTQLCAKPRCDDETQNGNEVGVDCGADSGCGLCDNGQSCASSEDCFSSACVADECAPATCDDESKNGGETDLNCGGECPACGDGKSCKRHSDCASGRCENDGEGNLVCQVPECEDDTKNGGETDIDCGGPCDVKCVLGQRCEGPDDCEEHACGKQTGSNVLVCRTPSCSDATKNGGETDVDCGGEGDCAPCVDGNDCSEHSDCESNHCDGQCLEATCDDNRQNNGETAVDCGGAVCERRCDVQDACAEDGDCLSELCSDELCAPGGAAAACRSDEGCLSGDCADEICAASSGSEPCRVSADCATQSCSDDGLCQQVYTGGLCESDTDCFSANCLDGACGPGIAGNACLAPEDCVTGRCVDNQCAQLDLVLQSNGNYNGSAELAVEFTIRSGSTTVAWADIAVLYFYAFADPPTAAEAAYVDMGQHFQAGGALSHQCVGVTNNDWIYVWRSNNSGNIGTSEFKFTLKLDNRTETGTSQPIDPTNDFSYRAGLGPTTTLLICRKVGDVWYPAQGTSPENIPDACQYVEPDCEDVICDAI